MTSQPKVTFGFINCNRLHYLRSNIESFLRCTEDYQNKEVIVVDNASIEDGTDEYLRDLKRRGYKVYKQHKRDPSNEYAMALNIVAQNATGDYIAPIPADVQFVVKGGWLQEYVNFFEQNKQTTGCISFDAQRDVRNAAGVYSQPLGDGKFKFLYHYHRNPIMGAANCLLTKDMLKTMYPWDIDNNSHEGGEDSETKMLHKIANILHQRGMKVFYAAPIIPVSVAIFNEDGDMARVRENKRYGDYWAPPNDETGVEYYQTHDFNDVVDKYKSRIIPVSIEEVAVAKGWKLPIDVDGNWIKSKGSKSAPCVEL